jgi:uncharacterized protein YjbJ (UPF0337 family)
MSDEAQHSTDQIAGAWKQVRREIRKEWGKLSNDDVEQIEGHREILADKIEHRYGITREEVNREIDRWAAARKV